MEIAVLFHEYQQFQSNMSVISIHKWVVIQANNIYLLCMNEFNQFGDKSICKCMYAFENQPKSIRIPET